MNVTFCSNILITHHIFIIITVVVWLSCVRVAVSDQILHSTTKCT